MVRNLKRKNQSFIDLYDVGIYYLKIKKTTRDSVQWDHSVALASATIERTQNKLLCRTAYSLRDSRSLFSSSLSDRRHMASLYFVLGLLNGNIDCVDTLSLLNFRVPLRLTRSSVKLHTHLQQQTTSAMSL